MNPPQLRPLHSEASLIAVKLEAFRKLATEDLIESLEPGAAGSLKVRPDGTILNGHHRITVLRERGIDVDALPRQIIRRQS